MQGGKRRSERTDQGVLMLQRKTFYSYVKMMHSAVSLLVSCRAYWASVRGKPPTPALFSPSPVKGKHRGDRMQQAEVEKSEAAEITLSIQRSRKESLTPSGLKEGQT